MLVRVRLERNWGLGGERYLSVGDRCLRVGERLAGDDERGLGIGGGVIGSRNGGISESDVSTEASFARSPGFAAATAAVRRFFFKCKLFLQALCDV